MKSDSNSTAAFFLVLTAVFQLFTVCLFVWSDDGSNVLLSEVYNEIDQTAVSRRAVFDMVSSLIFAYALSRYNKKSKMGFPYIYRPLLFWGIATLDISKILVMLFALPNITNRNKYFGVDINREAIRRKINSKWWVIGGIRAAICVVLFFLSVAQLSSEGKPIMYGLIPRLVTLIPAFLTSMAEIFFCKWVITDPYGLYTQPEQPRERNEDSIFRD